MLTLLLALTACSGPNDTADIGASADTDTDTDTDSDTDSDTDTGGSTLLPSYIIPPSLASGPGDAWLWMGPYSRAVMFASTTGMPTVPFTITELRFRRDDGGTDYAQTLTFSDVQLWLGTAAFDYPETDFASNYSGDETLVFDGTLQMDAVAGYDAAFDDWVVPLAAPFTFDPAAGKLLLELRIPAPGSYSSLDFLQMDCKNDASNYILMSDVAGLPDTAYISSGCGYAFEMVVEAAG